jgi:hypothetical protein
MLFLFIFVIEQNTLIRFLFSALEDDAEYPEWLDSLVNCTADGAAVNFGVHTGVISRVKRMKPHVIGLHCTAHRLELGLKNSTKNFLFMDTVNNFLENIWKFYKYSPQNWVGLKEAGVALGITVKKPSKAKGTRWVAHKERAIEVVSHNWPALVDIFFK